MRRALLSAFVVVALALCSLAQSAGAAYDPLGTATTTITLAKPFASFLKADGIAVVAIAPAKAKGAKLTLPLAEGKWDPSAGKGQVESAGAIVFQSARRKLPFKDLLVKANGVPLTAKVGGGKLKVAASKSISSERAGFGSIFTAKELRLSAKAATRLNKKLRTRVPFEAGQLLGSLSAASQPATMTVLAQNKAIVSFDPTFLAKLDSLFVSLNPIAPAELAPGPLLSLPIITGGTISPDGSLGTLRTGGDLEFLHLGGGQVFWHEQWLDLGARSDSAEANVQPSPPYAGKLGRIGVLDLGTGTVSADPNIRAVSLSGAPLTLQATTAAALNHAFAEGAEVFRVGEVIGDVGFVAVGP
jgi:hypothetical protein